jgi:hypothetical protein
MTSETNIVRLGLIAASKFGARMFRQNVGQGWIGKSAKLPNGDVVIKQARPFHAGFEGLLDTGGMMPVVITPDMVGQTFARYVEIEYKAERGRVSDMQRARISMVRATGGLAGVARTDDDVRAILAGEVRD